MRKSNLNIFGLAFNFQLCKGVSNIANALLKVGMTLGNVTETSYYS